MHDEFCFVYDMNILKKIYFYIFIISVSIYLGESSNVECCIREISSEYYSDECSDLERIEEYQFENFTKVVNSSVGLLELEVTFSAEVCSNQFVYLLKTSNVQNKNECRENNTFLKLTDSEYIHTRLIENHEEQKCIKKDTKRKFTFYYVFSGCYTLHVISCGDLERHFLLKPFYISTDLKRIDMTNYCQPTVYYQTIKEDQLTLDISVTFSDEICILNMYNLTTTLILELKTSKGLANEIRIENFDFGNNFSISARNSVSEVHCDRNSFSIFHCIIPKLHPDYYIILFKLLNDRRCKSRTLWNVNTSIPCEWDLKKKFDNLTTVVNSTGNNNILRKERSTIQFFYFIIIVAITVVICIILYILFTYFKLKKNNNKNNENLIKRTNSNKIESRVFFHNRSPRVFLLYARDCSEFMALMNNFRNILKKSGIDEVYDIFDENMNRDICFFQEKWILEKLVDPDVKIIFVLTKLAHLNYGLSSVNCLYKKPEFKDKYFIYSLKKIIENFSSDYQKLYVVELDTSLKMYYNELEVISPCRRYMLPQHFNELVTNISHENIDNTELEQYKETCKFIDVFNIYRLYVENNPEYLKNIINM